jgi:Putative beta barrel porin-7 (BBP7)
MMFRMLLAPCAVLVYVGMSLAQAPSNAPAPTEAPKPASDEVVSSPFALDFCPVGSGGKCFWVSADYGVTFFSPINVQPLATTSPAGTARASAGVVGSSSTAVLFGGNEDDGLRSSFRIAAGAWLNSEQTLGIEAGFMMTESQSALFFAASNSSSILARPYVDAVTGLPQAVLVAFPGSSSGSLGIRAESGSLYGVNLDFVGKTYDVGWFRLDSLIGYRFYRYNEDLGIQQTISPTNPIFIPGTQIVSGDSFRTRNTFNGVDLGFRSEFVFNSLSLDFLARVALGNLQSGIDINGSQTTTVPGSTPVFSSGGVNALTSNIGSYAAHHLEAWPEFGVTLKWQATSYLQLRVGYSILLLEGVARAASQIDPFINTANFAPATIPTSPLNPAFNFSRSDIFVQTVSAGLVFSY